MCIFLCVFSDGCLFLCFAAHVIAKAEGLAIISVIKAGFMITARGGSGIVIARLADRRKKNCQQHTSLCCFTLCFCKYHHILYHYWTLLSVSTGRGRQSGRDSGSCSGFSFPVSLHPPEVRSELFISFGCCDNKQTDSLGCPCSVKSSGVQSADVLWMLITRPVVGLWHFVGECWSSPSLPKSRRGSHGASWAAADASPLLQAILVVFWSFRLKELLNQHTASKSWRQLKWEQWILNLLSQKIFTIRSVNKGSTESY